MFQLSDERFRATGDKINQRKISKQISNEWKWMKVERGVNKKLKREVTEVDDDMPCHISASVPETSNYLDGLRFKEECEFMGLFLDT